jgi:hypothetical protein
MNIFIFLDMHDNRCYYETRERVLCLLILVFPVFRAAREILIRLSGTFACHCDSFVLWSVLIQPVPLLGPELGAGNFLYDINIFYRIVWIDN